MTNNDLQNTTQETKHRVTPTQLKTEEELRWSVRVSSSCCTSATRRVTAKRLTRTSSDIEIV